MAVSLVIPPRPGKEKKSLDLGYGAVSGAQGEHAGGVFKDDADDDGSDVLPALDVTWSRCGLVIAYGGCVCSVKDIVEAGKAIKLTLHARVHRLFLMAFITSLEGQVTYSLTAFAVSSFNEHSLISTVYVVQGVVNGLQSPSSPLRGLKLI